jgi:chromosome segregation protein
MDAPLDESNINRFLKILDRFVQQSQFVVITHNKRTISRGDVLYGVTMQERGVSRLVGVRLSDDGEDDLESTIDEENTGRLANAGQAQPAETATAKEMALTDVVSDDELTG